MRFPAAACTAVRPLVSGPPRPAQWLGASPTALYLGVPAAQGSGPGSTRLTAVVAVLARDAVRLPCGLRLATTSTELPVNGLVPTPASRPLAVPLLGGGQLRWLGPAGPVVVSVASEWAPRRAAPGVVSAGSLAQARAAVPGEIPGVARPLLAALAAAAGDAASEGAVAGLLGRGPGLTPSGDDVLAGFLTGASAFRLPASGLLRALAVRAPGGTTALSAQLLRHAAAGECIDEVADLAGALTGRGDPGAAARRLLAVGHSSGTALAHGLLQAAECALRQRPAAPPVPGAGVGVTGQAGSAA